MKRVGHLWDKLISNENLSLALCEVNRTHRWHKGHRPNTCTAWVEETFDERVQELRKILEAGFKQAVPRVSKRFDASAGKWREINEPKQWPDQYIHHALIQVLEPVFMRGMDAYCCGSIRGRGAYYGMRAISRWLKRDVKHTKYCLQCDIKHFYQSLKPEVVLDRMRQLIKDRRVLGLIERVISGGILIGVYTSQWFANTTLQPLDNMIREHEAAAYYLRYMDNITIFGSNKRKLRQLREQISKWLNQHGLQLKGDWQIYPADKRKPQALGYRYGRGYVLIRKRSLLRLKRKLKAYNKCKSKRLAAGLLSRIGQLKHCKNFNIYKRLFHGERVQRGLKQVIKSITKGELFLIWSMYLEQRERGKCLKQRAAATAI